MLPRLRLFAVLLAVLSLPLPVQGAEEEPTPSPAQTPTTPEASTDALACVLETAEAGEPLLETPAPTARSCQHTCPFGFCPDFPNLPPATCENGCCVYPACGGGECTFPGECPPFHDCIGGCCIHQT